MKFNSEYIDSIIVDFLTHQADEKVVNDLNEWLAESDANKKYFNDYKEIWYSSIVGMDERKYDSARAFTKFQERTSVGLLKKKRHLLLKFSKYAAVLFVLLMVSYFSYWQGENNIQNSFSDIIVEAPLGSNLKLSLPDGSNVWLNSGSKMSYSQGFGVSDRELKLVGEGYFEVVRNEFLPFIVNSSHLQVTVLCTKFIFRDYCEDDEAVVSLKEGKVAWQNLIQHDQKGFLSPNEKAVLDKRYGKIHIESSVVDNALQWTKGALFFDEVPFVTIVKALERSYDVHITIMNDSLRNHCFYGNFVRNEQSIRDVLDALSATTPMHYDIKGSNITIY